MLKSPESADVGAWHKYFAMSNNNRAWQLAAMPTRTAAEDQEMLSTAHAAAVHWTAVGTPLNVSRANMLLAAVHSLLGPAELAWSLAEETKKAFDKPDTPAWETAFVHVFHAHAAAISGRTQPHRDSYASAKAAIAALADPQDRQIVEASFVQVPSP